MESLHKPKLCAMVGAISVAVMGFGTPAVNAAKTRLDWWMWPAGTEVLKKFEQIASTFNGENPTLNVKLNQVAYGTYMDKMQAMIAAGKPADMMQLDHATYFWFAGKNLLQDITPMYRREIDADDLFGSVMDSTYMEGKRYGVVPFYHVITNYYNEKLFAEAGIQTPEQLWQSKRWDWLTFLESVKKLTRRDGSGKVLQFGLQSGWSLNDVFVWTAGGEYTDKNQREFLLNSPAAIEGMQFVYDLSNRYGVMKEPKDPDLQFGQGKVGIYVGGTWERLQLASKAKNVKWDIVPFPVHPTVRKEVTWLDRAVYVLPRNTKKNAAAFQFMKFCLGKKAQEILASTFDVVPVRKSVALSSAFLNSGEPVGAKVNNGALLRGIENGKFSPAGYRWQRAWNTVMAPRMAKVSAGQMTPKEAVTGVKADFEKLLNRK